MQRPAQVDDRPAGPGGRGGGQAVRNPGFLFLDPPDHTRLRRLVSKAFSPKVVKSMEAGIAELVDGLLAKAGADGSFEAISELAYPCPSR